CCRTRQSQCQRTFLLLLLLSLRTKQLLLKNQTRKLIFWDGIYERAKTVPPKAAFLFYLRRTISFLELFCILFSLIRVVTYLWHGNNDIHFSQRFLFSGAFSGSVIW